MTAEPKRPHLAASDALQLVSVARDAVTKAKALCVDNGVVIEFPHAGEMIRFDVVAELEQSLLGLAEAWSSLTSLEAGGRIVEQVNA